MVFIVGDRENGQSLAHSKVWVIGGKWNKIIYDYLSECILSENSLILFSLLSFVPFVPVRSFARTSTQCQGGALVTVCITHVFNLVCAFNFNLCKLIGCLLLLVKVQLQRETTALFRRGREAAQSFALMQSESCCDSTKRQVHFTKWKREKKKIKTCV